MCACVCSGAFQAVRLRRGRAQDGFGGGGGVLSSGWRVVAVAGTIPHFEAVL